MKQRVVTFLVWVAIACVAQAHFIFVVPEEGGSTARAFLSETLEPSGVGTDLVGKAKLVIRDAEGRETPLSMDLSGDHYMMALPGGGQRVVYGFADLGFMNRGTPHLLLYYPKTILGNAFDPGARVGDSAVVEIIPHGRPGDLTLQVITRGKPQADAEITVILPDGTEKVVKTDENGQTESFTETGRYGAWARFWEDKSGERDGSKYQQIRHYAMLVFDAQAQKSTKSDAPITASKFASMPEAASSFGAAVADGWLYVYGGHIAPTHNYSTEAVSGRFHRLRLSGEPTWEELPGGPGLQGMNLASHKGFVYRVGGMEPRNAPGEPTDNHSVADVARFNPKKMKWESLPPLPEPRSSHDAVVVGDQLFVVGGWTMQGKDGEEWLQTTLVMDLAKKKPKWRTIEQPFVRRALMAAGYDNKVYVVGGFTEENKAVRTVDVYDTRSKTWSKGPELPEHGRATGFAPAVGVHEGRLYVSVFDGTLLRLNEPGTAWEAVGKSTPRLAHRLASGGDTVLVMGGANRGKNFDLIEAVTEGSGD